MIGQKSTCFRGYRLFFISKLFHCNGRDINGWFSDALKLVQPVGSFL